MEDAATTEHRAQRVRRAPPRFTADNHVYVGRRQQNIVLLKLVQKLFDKRGHEEVYIHGIGPAIPKSVHLVQDVLLHYGDDVLLEPSIGTVDVVDDILENFEVQDRSVSSLTLKLRRRTDG
mmetsp:Transcript_21675/g.49345  ORF Transcript_21675/g.49345 Transcript_21675/m.49345 type:complete len:121 (-) Transcript_21675:66-428(-)